MSTKHGKCYTPEWYIWYGIITRCKYPSSTVWKYYGGRGVTVCDRWTCEDGFMNFLADMGTMPAPKMEIDRQDNDGNYEPSNCHWATRKRQMRNTSKTWYAPNGEAVADLCDQVGLPMSMVYQRVNKMGWDLDEALETPRKHNGPKAMPERPHSRARKRKR